IACEINTVRQCLAELCSSPWPPGRQRARRCPVSARSGPCRRQARTAFIGSSSSSVRLPSTAGRGWKANGMAQAESTWRPEDQGWVRENLREAIDHLVEMGYTVRGGGVEDPELINPGGSAVETWREDYPYDELMTREEYELEKYRLQIELLKFQYWGQDHELKHVIVFEGREGAGQGGTIKRFTEIGR